MAKITLVITLRTQFCFFKRRQDSNRRVHPSSESDKTKQHTQHIAAHIHALPTLPVELPSGQVCLSVRAAPAQTWQATLTSIAATDRPCRPRPRSRPRRPRPCSASPLLNAAVGPAAYRTAWPLSPPGLAATDCSYCLSHAHGRATANFGHVPSCTWIHS